MIQAVLFVLAAACVSGPAVPVAAQDLAEPAAGNATAATNNPDDATPVVVELLTDVATAAPGQVFQVGISMKVAPDWHVYAPWPGNTGEPTLVVFSSDAKSVILGPAKYRHPMTWDRDNFDLTSFGYEGHTLISSEAEVRGIPAGNAVTITADVSWLACKKSCVGGSASREITIPVDATPVPGSDVAIFGASPFPPDLEAVDAWLSSVTYDGQGVWDLKYRVEGFAGLDEFAPQWINGGDCMLDKWSWQAVKPAGAADAPGDSWELSVLMRGSNCLPFAGGFLKGTRTGGSGPGMFKVRAFGDPEGNPWKRDTADAAAEDGNKASAASDGGTAGADDNTAAGSGPEATPKQVSFWLMLLLAFAGGLLLNVMPCVIPVIIPKLNHLVKTAIKYQDRRERNQLLLLNGLAYTGGILATMMGIAVLIVILKAVGNQVGWGFQFQNPYFLAIMCAVLMLMSLGMLDVFPLQMIGHTDDLRELRATRKKGVVVESFMTGLLVTFLGTPCTAPLLGPAAGFAFLAGPGQIFAFFAVLGVGFALPFLLLAVLPGWSAHLGNFRVSEKANKWSHGLAFFLLATMVWLMLSMDETYHVRAVVRLLWLLLAISAAAWIYGLRCRFFEEAATARLERSEQEVMRDEVRDTQQKLAAKAGLNRAFNSAVRRNRLLWGSVLVAIVVATAIGVVRFDESMMVMDTDKVTEGGVLPQSGPVKWRKWSQAAVDEARAEGKAVFVDATAKWCMNCKTNELMVLDRQGNADMFVENGVVPFKADFSRRDPAIAALIESHDRVGVPVYLVYPPCRGDPIILPEILTPEMVRAALEKVGPSLPAGCPAP